MLNWNKKQWMVFWVMSAMATALVLPHAHAELVFDEEDSARASDRESSKKALGVAYQQEERVEPVQVQEETPKLTRSQMMMKKRIREELKTEDALQERLEELRLQKELEISKRMGGAAADVAPVAPSQSENVSGAGYGAPDQIAMTQAVPASVGAPAPGQSISAKNELDEEKSDDSMTISISPRFGIADFTQSNGYNTQSRFSLGGGILFGFSDHLSLEAGYTYSEYGVNINSTNPFVNVYQYSFNNGASPNYNTLILKQNVGDLGLRVHVLDRKAKVRPYVAGGGGYSQSFVNYDPRIITYLQQTGVGNSVDYSYTQLLGYVGGGLDIQLAKNVSLGASGKYYSVLSADESNQLNNAAFFAPGAMNPLSYDKASTAGTLSRAGFYTLHLNVNFTF